MTILVTGGTGNVGLPLLDALSHRDDVRALVHTDTAAETVEKHGAVAVRGDLTDPASLPAAFDGVDTLFLLSPFFEGHQALEHNALDAAQEASVRRVVKFAYAGLDWPIALTSGHREIRDRLAGSSFDVTLLLSDIFATNLLGQADLIAGGQLVLPGRAARIAYTDPADVGAVAAHLVSTEEPVPATVVVTGPELLSNERAAEIAGTAYGSTALYVEAPATTWAQSLADAGWPLWIANAVAEMHTTVADRGPLPVTDSTERYLGRPAHSLTDFFARVTASKPAASS